MNKTKKKFKKLYINFYKVILTYEKGLISIIFYFIFLKNLYKNITLNRI